MDEIASELAEQAAAGRPLVVMNAPFDLTLLDRELRRHRASTLDHWFETKPLRVLDPRVLDKHLDRYRKGRRTLTDLCAHYGVVLEGAHDAAADALASMDVVRAVGRRFPARLERLSPPNCTRCRPCGTRHRRVDCRRGSRAAARRRRWIRRGRCVRTCRRPPEHAQREGPRTERRTQKNRSVCDGPAFSGWAILGSNQ